MVFFVKKNRTLGGHDFVWFGVSNGTQCFCSVSFSASYETTCNIPCPGNPEQICGGVNGISIYGVDNACVSPPEISAPVTEPVPEPAPGKFLGTYLLI